MLSCYHPPASLSGVEGHQAHTGQAVCTLHQLPAGPSAPDTETQTDRQADTDRQTDRHRQTDTHTHVHTEVKKVPCQQTQNIQAAELTCVQKP